MVSSYVDGRRTESGSPSVTSHRAGRVFVMMSNPYQSPSEVTVAETALPPDAHTGRAFVLILIVFNTLLAFAVIGLIVATGNDDRLPRALVRLVINVGLMYGLWSGTRWIKWLFVLGLFLSAMFFVVWAFRVQGSVMLLIVAIAALLAWAAWNLAFGASVNKFLAFQRNRGDIE